MWIKQEMSQDKSVQICEMTCEMTFKVPCYTYPIPSHCSILRYMGHGDASHDRTYLHQCLILAQASVFYILGTVLVQSVKNRLQSD